MSMCARCSKCNLECAPKDEKDKLFGLPCDICRQVLCRDCSGVRSSEIRVLILKERTLRFFCSSCLECFYMIPLLHKKVSDLEAKFDVLSLGNSTGCERPSDRQMQVNDSNVTEEHSKTDDAGDGVLEVAPSVIPEILTDTITLELKNQAENIAEKLEGVVKAIIKSNTELVQLMTSPTVTKNVKDSIQRQSNDKEKTTEKRNSGKANAHGHTDNVYLTTKRNSIIKGTNNNHMSLSAATERKWMYVGNLSPDCTVDKVKSHLESNGITILSCDSLASKFSHMASFKISIAPNLQDKLMNGDLWPVGVTVKPFISYANKGRSFGGATFRKKPPQGQRR